MFFVFCADDVVLDRNAVRVLVDEAVVSNAGIVGPKLVLTARATSTVDVGWLVDRYGEAWSIVGPRHNQEQHDAVRDVFFVSAGRCSCAATCSPRSTASTPHARPRRTDLAWRARIAGAGAWSLPPRRAAWCCRSRGGRAHDTGRRTRAHTWAVAGNLQDRVVVVAGVDVPARLAPHTGRGGVASHARPGELQRC